MKILYPDEYLDQVYNIDFESLYEKGYRAVLFDVDNTLVPFDQLDAHDALIHLMKTLRTMGYKVALVSNNSKARVDALNKGLKIPVMANAMKPFTYKLKRILKTIGVHPQNAIFVGDQIFTDVWVGNRLGLYTILVKPIQSKEQMVTFIKRRTEKLLLNRYLKKEGR
ncbi:YqeG family HAD IIIA-type phosphatase [Petrocella sp. FN5]|uniref:YqeG family HAD IIIA-type phosphatase n=1 Tax=Petrocella sp. FN5 TaxID=3032002 RepID=UPI0023DA03CD|nr:YqeG family HAD IIIA-type phosphatase [Petrocella sp. FN5]MDF1617023.1 YqeG family HAD IIIA-type phosphatase [Petrocella sp. FN5]